MLENRSFDHMLGFLYADSGQRVAGRAAVRRADRDRVEPRTSGPPVTVFKIEPTTPNAYFMPGADPGEGYMATNDQLFGSTDAPASPGACPP